MVYVCKERKGNPVLGTYVGVGLGGRGGNGGSQPGGEATFAPAGGGDIKIFSGGG